MSQCQQFHANPRVNPQTGRDITIGGPTYRKLVELCGQPPGPVPAYLEQSVRAIAPSVVIVNRNSPRAMIIVRGPQFNEAYNIPMIPETAELISNLQETSNGAFYIGSQALRGLLSPYYIGKAGNQVGPFQLVINLEPENI
jgi:hypothetical protein